MLKISKIEKVAALSIASNTFLIILKVMAGILSGSISILSEAIHSSMDLLASLIAFFSVRMSAKPADKSHPYGHGKIENVSGVIEGVLIFIAAFLIIQEATKKIMNPGEGIKDTLVAVIVMFISAAVNFFVSRILYKTAKKEDSIALEADALHLKTDVYTSIGVGGGLLLIKFAEFIGIKNAEILDPIAAIAVALLIIKESWVLCRNAFSPLLDAKLSDEEEEKIVKIVNEHKDKIFSFHRLRTRKAGKVKYVDFHLVVDGALTVEEAHNLSDKLEEEIAREIKHCNVNIHIEPSGQTEADDHEDYLS